jgi:VWFA-related protein
MSRRLIGSVLVLAAAGLSGTSPRAQEPVDPEQAPIFRTRVDVVTVDVVVTDRQGRPVTDLTAADFEVRESGRPQTIESFQLIQTDDGLEDPLAKRDILSFDEHRREVSRSDNRLFVIFLDDYHVRRINSMRVREQLAEFVSGLTPHDLVAITTPLRPPSAMTFSRNHAATANELLNFVGRKYDYRPMNPLEERYASEPPATHERIRNEWTISGLRSLCTYMAAIRDGRKSILYVSEGMTGTLPAGAMVETVYGRMPAGRGGSPTAQPDSNQMTREFFDSASLLSDLQVVFGAASRGNTSIYTLDPRGLAVSEYTVEDLVTPGADTRQLNESSDNLRIIADETNGRAIVSRNDPMPALQQMHRDSSTYYLLTYTSSLSPRDGKFQEIQVRVRRNNLDVRARKGYWALTSEDVARATSPPKPPPSADVVQALDALATTVESGRRRPVTLWTGAERGADQQALVTVAWEASVDAAALPSDRVESVNITATSVTGETLFSGDAPRQGGAAAPLGHIRFAAPPGPVRVRVQSSNAAGRSVEATDLTVEVPDFTNVGPTVTTPFVFRGRTARDLQVIRSAASPSPTVARAFTRFERLLIRFGAYGPGGTTPELTLKLLNQGGDVIATLPTPVKVASQFESEVGLGTFPPGSYLLEIAARLGEETTRAVVAFRVTG